MGFDILPKNHLEPFGVSTPIGESVRDERLYPYCTISNNHKDTMNDLVELDIVDFDIVLGLD